jgi:hypothetical protein
VFTRDGLTVVPVNLRVLSVPERLLLEDWHQWWVESENARLEAATKK